MARRTLDEQISTLEARRDSLETQIESHQGVSRLKAQGSYGAETDFIDPLKLQQILNQVNNKLAILYTQKDNL